MQYKYKHRKLSSICCPSYIPQSFPQLQGIYQNGVFHANKVRMSEGLAQKPVRINMDEYAHLSETQTTALASKQNI